MNTNKAIIPLALSTLITAGCSMNGSKSDAPENCKIDHYDKNFHMRVDLSLDGVPLYTWNDNVKEGLLSTTKENGPGPEYFPETSNFVSHKILLQREVAEKNVAASTKVYIDWSLRALVHPNNEVLTAGEYTVYEPETFSIGFEAKGLELNEHVSFERKTSQGVFVADIWTCNSY